ncbi:MAG TPA: hypothetical protein VEY91_05780 [Candidatus Limnocylindria bacterium]|nr:hypothetical protein [Candidatus Limnocylindria bacterium]
MIPDPERRGRVLADLYRVLGPRLFDDLEESGLLQGAPPAQARAEWECFALYACVRGLVAAGGFNRETGAALDAFHETLLSEALAGTESMEGFTERRGLVARRYEEYGAIGQEGGASGAATVASRLGVAAARHLTAPESPPDGLAELVGALHEALVEGAAEAVRSAS